MRPLCCLLTVLFAMATATTVNAAPRNPSGFEIQRGVNLSHWLSQCPRELNRATFITEKDFAFIRSIGYDHVRLPVDEVELWTADGQRIEPAFRVMTTALDWARKHGLRTVVDLHTVRAHHFNNEYGTNTLWTDPAAQKKFLLLWEQLSAVLKPYPNAWVAYEIMNEPVADDAGDWNKLVAAAVADIRRREPNRVLIIGSNRWQQPATFPALQVPAGDRNIILSVHSYEPFGFTHHRASWADFHDYRGPVQYPGQTIPTAEWEKLPPGKKKDGLHHAIETWDRARLARNFQPAIDKARQLGLQLYCGEFGCLPYVDRSQRLAWYRDMVGILEENGLAWANWDYKGHFGIIAFDFAQPATARPDDDLIKALLPR